MNVILENPIVHADVSGKDYKASTAFELIPSSQETNGLVHSEMTTSGQLDNQQTPMNHLLVLDNAYPAGRKRADSTGDALERLTLFEENLRQCSGDSSPPPILTGPATPAGVTRRLWSLQPDSQASRDISHIATPTRPKVKRGKTIDTSTVRKTEEEDVSCL